MNPLQATAGVARPYLAWGLAALRQYMLLAVDGQCLAIIDSHAEEGVDPLTGLPVLKPERLADFDAAAIELVIFADPQRFGAEIRRMAAAYGPFQVSDYPQRLRRCQRPSTLPKRCAQSGPGEGQGVVLWVHQLVNGGAEKQICLLACGLRQLGHSVTLITSRPDSPSVAALQQRLAGHGVSRLVLDDCRGFVASERQPPPADWVAPRVAGLFDPIGCYLLDHTHALLQQLRPALLVAYLDDANLIAGMAAVLAGVPRVLLSGRNVAPPDLPLYPVLPVAPELQASVYQWLLAQPGVALFNNSAAGARSYERWLGGRVAVVTNAVLPPAPASAGDLRRQLAVPPGQPLIGGIMRLAAEKQPLAFVEVIARLVTKGLACTACLVGDGPLRAEVEARIEALGLGQQLRLLGNQDDASSYLPQFDLLLLTSAVEGTPNVLLEAMAAGTPVVATDVGGVRDCLPPAIHGQLVTANDWPRFVDCILNTLVAPPPMRSEPVSAWLAQRSETALAQATLALTDHMPTALATAPDPAALASHSVQE